MVILEQLQISRYIYVHHMDAREASIHMHEVRVGEWGSNDHGSKDLLEHVMERACSGHMDSMD